MSENINLDSNNLSIPEDAFEQFQVNSMYEEEEYITLSDIVSPEPAAQQLPSDISEIPYDNEVVLSANDDPNSDNLAGTATSDPANSVNVSVYENNENIEQPTEQVPDQNNQGRPKRIRKQKSYVDDFVTDLDEKLNLSVENDVDKKNASNSTPTKRRRGRKPKQNIAQNEMTQPEGIDLGNVVEQTPSKRGRKKVIKELPPETLNNVEPVQNQETLGENSSEVVSQDVQDNSTSIKTSARKQTKRQKNNSVKANDDSTADALNSVESALHKKGRPKKNLPKETLSNSSEPLVDTKNILSGELMGDNSFADIPPKTQKKGRRGRPKNVSSETTGLQLLEADTVIPQQLQTSVEDSNSIIDQKIHPKRGRKRKVQKAVHTENNVSDDDDELDNVSLKILSKKQEDNGEKCLDLETATVSNVDPKSTEYDEIDVGDEMILSELKETLDEVNTEVQDMELDETVETYKTELDNSELNIKSADNTTKDIDNGDNYDTTEMENDSLLLEDTSKRPVRQRAKKVMHYDEESDEDPFANVELSDDEPSGKRGRYYSDEEYVPGSEKKKGGRAANDATTDEDSDISEIDDDLEGYQKGKRKRLFSANRNRGKKCKKDEVEPLDVNVTTIVPKVGDEIDDIEGCLQSSVIQANENSIKKPTSVYTEAFENFIAQKIQGTNIKIKKVSSEQSSQSAPLEIPILDPDAKKAVDVSVQTNIVKTTSSGVQTYIQHEIGMKDNVPLTTEQSEKACEFLKSIVKTTSELGQLMTEKSEDFISKKINLNHVTDTFKMDYCVKKSFLLLKLAKHNIVQMEDDLAKQYEDFLKRTDLISHRQEEKVIKATEKDNDSDCEIVEEIPSTTVKKEKPKFNPKTVFLNKELSIKIAKKPASKNVADKCKDKLNIKNKTSVWISDSVMVKKVKPTQSFLAQDSRTKKPPDCFVTNKMVSDFFDSYYKKLAPSICAPFTNYSDWQGLQRNYVCNYFFVKLDKASDASTSYPESSDILCEGNNKDTTTEHKTDNTQCVNEVSGTASPRSLITLCTEVLKVHMKLYKYHHTLQKNDSKINFEVQRRNSIQSPDTLFRLCLNIIGDIPYCIDKSESKKYQEVEAGILLNCIKTNTFLNVESMRSDFENNEAMSNEESPRVSPYFDEMVPLLDFEKDRVLHNVENREILFDVETEKVLSDIKNTESLPKVSSVKVTSDVKESKLQLLIEPETLPIDKNVIVMTLKTLCLKKIIELLHMPIEEEENGLENNDSASENSIILSDNGSYMSVSNYEIDDMIAELDLVVKTEVKSLFSLCVAIFQKVHKDYVKNVQKGTLDDLDNFIEKNTSTVERTPKSLKCLTFELINNMMHMNFSQNSDVTVTKLRAPVYKVKRLADICFKNISLHMTDNYENDIQINKNATGMTINCVNTLSEEAFHNMEEENVEDDYGEDFYEEDNFGGDFNSFQEEGNNWESQVHIQEFKPCIDSSKQMSESQVNEGDTLGAENSNLPVKETMTARIKTEPSDEMTEGLVDTTIVKTEVLHHDEMAIIPESIVTKQEHTENAGDNRDRVPLQRHSSSSFDVDSFEDFVRRNKMMHALDEPNDEAYTQSGQRVRRQHEPDYMNEYDPSLNLLVPQTFEPLSVVNAKGVLMASSSDDERGNQKSTSKKKDKRGKVPKKGERPKKGESKQPNKEVVNSKSKEIPAVKGNLPHSSLNELTILTRRMREKIRQEEKKVASSDSEGENIPIARKKDRKENEKAKSSKNTKENPAENEKAKSSKNTKENPAENEKAKSSKNTKENPAENETKAKSSKSAKESPTEDEIQCSNVDSTEQIDQNDSTEDDKNFTGFSTVDQNEITRYQKYVKFVYDKIMPKHVENNEKNNVPDEEKREHPSMCNSNENDDRSCSPLINYDEPAEMLECQPTMPIFDESFQNEKQRKKLRPKSKIVKEAITAPAQENVKNTEISQEIVENDKPVYTERNGWQCYPINPNETKLYENAAIILEKLPETFVETYFEYQQLTGYQDEDKEVDRLINLNTLNRSSIKEVQKIKGKGKVTKNEQLGQTTDTSRVATPTSDGCAELTASEDEGANVDDELPPPVPSRHTNENNLAKSSLMDDSDSEETLSKIKEEPNNDTQADPKAQLKKKPKGKAPTQTVKSEHPESLMLTADKSLNKELNLLHAPVVLSNEVSEKGEKGPSPRTRNKRGLRGHTSRDYMKNEEGSSSEEEKQWVSTKEKLLKRMGKKQDTASADDAKRAKLVTEFIERRGVALDGGARKRGPRGRGRKRNSRKALEREKQMRVLSHELFGAPVDPALMGTRHAQFSQSYFKGRRNIRKVIDKKSLARSTVIANMEEFERKCRLNQRQAQLSELLGCEEGVNVLVINDEVCLEYGFEQQSPLISVHPFFTKVMKAHQYEGVKFMWDACFETLEKVESGHPGGGCILAHCMGLGKTLQVLALLHTVLTHPRVGMQRVLVCCPLSTVLNWVDEIHKWIGPVTDQIKVFELSKLKKTSLRAYQLEDWYSGGGIFIIGYELFRSLTTLDPELDDIRPTIVQKIRTALLDPGPDIVVCDEGHLLKNDCSVLAVAMSRVATKRRIVLTGTPMQNNLREYYCMVNFVKPNLLGTYSEYSNRFENPIMNGQHRDSREEDIKLMKQRTHILHKVLEGCLQRQEASVLYPYLPKKHEYTVFISLTKVQWDLYKHYINNYSNNTKQSVLKDFHILQKIWSHPQVLHNFQTKRRDELATQIKPEKLEDDLAHEDLTSEVLKAEEARADEAAEAWWLQFLDGGAMLDSLECSNKFTVVFKILDECIALGDKVLIFSTSLFTMDALEYFLKKINKWSLGQEYYRLDGSVPAEVRQKWCREFNAELNHRTKLFLISTRAGSLGLNMVAANRVIILDTSWNPAHDIQSIFRVYRFGQKKDCYIYRLVALGTMEQKIYERSVTKQAVSCRVVDEQQIDRHYNMAELTELYKYDEQGLSVLGGVAVGVTDVALLRVARHPALHAVHEHDSLLRGSSEQQLPEHERAAAWMQFQQEHAHKQMQNQLTSSFSLHLPMPSAAAAPQLQTYRDLVQGTGHLPDIKPETPNLLVPYQPKPPGKAGRPRKKVPPPEALQQLPSESEEIKTQKIMHILIKHNYQDRQGPKEITELVSMVQKIVACGRVPPGKFHNIIAREIAEVLLVNEITPSTQENTNSQEKRGRGRPRKQTEEGDTKPYIPPWGVSSEPSTSKDYSTYTPRRRAAINAEKQIEKESAIEADNDRQEHIEDDWQNDSSEEITPETKPQKKTTTPRAVTVKTENVTKPNENDSILLSDDDEPAPTTAKQTKNTETKKPEQKKTEEKKADKEVIPLHPSLLDNKNFIKIVAHTYLEGNPMLDEDAAILAAQYSTLKAKKEIEATGQAIVNGPIYDIAVKVLGIDILEKLHTTNPVAKKLVPAPSKAPEVKSEPVAEPRRPGPRLKAKGIGELTGKSDPPPATPAPPPATPTAPTVVPVGLINRTGGITPTAAGVTPVAQFAPQPREESILPHDDDVIAHRPAPAPASTKNIFTKNSKPLIFNSILATKSSAISSAQPKPVILNSVLTNTNGPAQPKIPKLIISAGKLLPATGFSTITPPKVTPAATPAVSNPPPASDTICLDSDEETPPEPAPKPRKRVAVKSTAKPAVPPAAPPAPVPVSISAANPQFSFLHQPETITTSQLNTILQQQPPKYSSTKILQPIVSEGTITLGYAPPANSASKFVVVPASQVPGLSRLPSGVSQPLLKSLPDQNYIPQNPVYPTTSLPQTVMTQPITSTQPLAPEPPRPKRSMPTRCKPGDILRVTRTGQIEVLNREEDDVSIVEDAAAPPPSQPARPPVRARGRTATPQEIPTPTPPPQNTPQPPENTVATSDRTRKVSVSSSSSSDSSRPSSPEPDPLSIFKDVVHIKAPEDDSPKVKPKTIGNTSISKATGPVSKTIPPSKVTYNKEPLKTQTKQSTPAKSVSQDEIMKHISKTDTILKKLDKALSEKNQPTPQRATRSQKASTSATKQTPVSSVTAIDTIIDLDSYVSGGPTQKAGAKYTTKPAPPAKQTKPAPSKSTVVPKPTMATTKEPTKTKEPVKTIVGTSKDIIISITGKSSTMTTTANSGNKARVATMDKLAPTTYAGKKRPAPSDAGPQKKKNAPMTLKDFNIDDIDDIIELE